MANKKVHITTIKVTGETKCRLIDLRRYRRESYDEILNNILDDLDNFKKQIVIEEQNANGR